MKRALFLACLASLLVPHTYGDDKKRHASGGGGASAPRPVSFLPPQPAPRPPGSGASQVNTGTPARPHTEHEQTPASNATPQHPMEPHAFVTAKGGGQGRPPSDSGPLTKGNGKGDSLPGPPPQKALTATPPKAPDAHAPSHFAAKAAAKEVKIAHPSNGPAIVTNQPAARHETRPSWTSSGAPSVNGHPVPRDDPSSTPGTAVQDPYARAPRTPASQSLAKPVNQAPTYTYVQTPHPAGAGNQGQAASPAPTYTYVQTPRPAASGSNAQAASPAPAYTYVQTPRPAASDSNAQAASPAPAYTYVQTPRSTAAPAPSYSASQSSISGSPSDTSVATPPAVLPSVPTRGPDHLMTPERVAQMRQWDQETLQYQLESIRQDRNAEILQGVSDAINTTKAVLTGDATGMATGLAHQSSTLLHDWGDEKTAKVVEATARVGDVYGAASDVVEFNHSATNVQNALKAPGQNMIKDSLPHAWQAEPTTTAGKEFQHLVAPLASTAVENAEPVTTSWVGKIEHFFWGN